jgi:hypothetical protein
VIKVRKEIIFPDNPSDLTASKAEREIILFANSDDPVTLVIQNGMASMFLKDNSVAFRQVQLPPSTSEKPVKVFAFNFPQNPTLWFIRQNPGVTINSGGKTIEDNGLFGIRCSVDLANKETNPPELAELLEQAKVLGWNINSYIIALLGMVRQK